MKIIRFLENHANQKCLFNFAQIPVISEIPHDQCGPHSISSTCECYLFTCSRSGSKNEVPRGRDGWRPAQTHAFLFEPSQYPEHPEGEQQNTDTKNQSLIENQCILSVSRGYVWKGIQDNIEQRLKSHKGSEEGGTGSSRGAASGCEETSNGQILRKTRRFY